MKDIQQLSYGCCACHFLAKNSQNAIFVTGSNAFGGLGRLSTNTTDTLTTPEELSPQYVTIWGDVLQSKSKSARK